ncbi:MAG: hypothetical protein ACT4TC_14555 [Myxococcaceae bacterium]
MKRQSKIWATTLAALGLFGCGVNPEAAKTPAGDSTLVNSSLTALTEASRCTIAGETGCVLNTAKAARAVTVVYPNANFCELRLLSTLPYALRDTWNAFLPQVDVSLDGVALAVVAPADGQALSFDLGTEVTEWAVLEVRTKDGSALDQVIKSAFVELPNYDEEIVANQLLAIPVPCPRAP